MTEIQQLLSQMLYSKKATKIANRAFPCIPANNTESIVKLHHKSEVKLAGDSGNRS